MDANTATILSTVTLISVLLYGKSKLKLQYTQIVVFTNVIHENSECSIYIVRYRVLKIFNTEFYLLIH
jgi:hypothetical protein